ncbi:MFS transporter [Silicimonas sp. MF1-12-2]|uniref:MFS transporter n=1 Tax=Silicimonas sp. MF1-12-2 TaxID=3384793 RepID=UPI0039B538A3
MDRQETTRATLLIMAVFVLQPFAIGGWLALIPVVKEALGLSKSELALALIGMPIALIPGLQIAGRAMTRIGPRRVLRAFFPIQALVVLLPLLAWSGPSLFGALVVLGAAVAFNEVAMNVYAGRLEKRGRVMIMNRCHGFWAAGIMGGSALVALMPGLTPMQVLAGLAVISGAGGVLVAVSLPRLGDEETGIAPPRRRLSELPRALIFVALFMFFVTLTEGTMADWAAVYLAERLGDPDASAGIAVTVFSAFMAGGRFLGDWLKRLMGGVALARLTTTSAILGLFVLIVPLPVWLALPGFALVGFGISAAYPLGVSAIAALDDHYESANIAIMATVALGGFLIGPPLIGFVSEAFTLSVGFATLLPGLILALWLTRWLRPESRG